MLHLLPHNPMQEAQSLKREIKIFKSLRHDRIVTYFDAMEVNAVFYIFMEYMPGVSYGLNVTMHVDMHVIECQWSVRVCACVCMCAA